LSLYRGHFAGNPNKKQAMIITGLYYKFYEADDYLQIPITTNTGTFNESNKKEDAGVVYTSEVSAYSAHITTDYNDLFTLLSRRPPIIKVTDNAQNSYTLGSDTLKGEFTFEKIHDGKPGGKHGYNLKISLKSTTGAQVEVL
jgi:hypothetical protein